MVNSERVTTDFQAMVNIVIWNSLGFFFLDFLVPYVASQELFATGSEMGVIFSVQVIGYMICSPFVGYISDSMSKSKLILIGSFGRGFAYFILYIAIILRSVIGLAIGTFSLGFFAGFFWIPLNSLIAEKSDLKHRSFAYGKRDKALGIGTFYGAFAGFFIFILAFQVVPDNRFIIYCALVLFGAANLYTGLSFFRHVDESITYDSQFPSSEIKNESKNSYISKALIIALIMLLIVLFLSATNGTLARPFLNVYLVENIENDPFLATLAYAPAGIVSMMLAPRLGEIADKINPYLGISIASVVGAIATLFLINTSNLFLFSLLLVIDVTIVSTGGLILQNFLSRISTKHRGKIFGLQGTSSNFGYALGPILGGIVWDSYGPKAPFTLSIFFELALIPLFIMAMYYLKPHLQEK
ncbi:MAG: MFS transporter [Candidatus Heimdallarchaeota archaeon]|nr:MFS transporter [Candidatus Heimdallarchaeota archaeon]